MVVGNRPSLSIVLRGLAVPVSWFLRRSSSRASNTTRYVVNGASSLIPSCRIRLICFHLLSHVTSGCIMTEVFWCSTTQRHEFDSRKCRRYSSWTLYPLYTYIHFIKLIALMTTENLLVCSSNIISFIKPKKHVTFRALLGHNTVRGMMATHHLKTNMSDNLKCPVFARGWLK